MTLVNEVLPYLHFPNWNVRADTLAESKHDTWSIVIDLKAATMPSRWRENEMIGGNDNIVWTRYSGIEKQTEEKKCIALLTRTRSEAELLVIKLAFSLIFASQSIFWFVYSLNENVKCHRLFASTHLNWILLIQAIKFTLVVKLQKSLSIIKFNFSVNCLYHSDGSNLLLYPFLAFNNDSRWGDSSDSWRREFLETHVKYSIKWN